MIEKNSKIETLQLWIEKFIFAGRWLLAPMYVGLIIGEFVYAYKFLESLVELLHQSSTIKETDLLLAVLGLVDITMIGNLIAMITIGGYSIFVREINIPGLHGKPRWLNNISSGTLKIKMCASLIGVTSIHLLKTFINIEHAETKEVVAQVAIHLVFLVSIIVMAIVEKMLHPHPHPPAGVNPGSNYEPSH